MTRRAFIPAVLFALALASAQSSEARSDVYAYVAVWDVAAEQAADFERILLRTGKTMVRERGFINERVLRNIDSLTYHYATYTKSYDRRALESRMLQRTKALREFLRRDPETHLAQLKSSYYPAAATDQPNGRELGGTRTGQIAHLGLFIPYPQFRGEYDRTLHQVKVVTRSRQPQGYIGDDVLVEAEVNDLAAQTPYSPHAFETSPMSINYGEYDTLEDAENSYIKRGGDRPTDPAYLALERIFYSVLQVPTRFYIFRVIGNVSGPDRRSESASSRKTRPSP